MDYEIDALYEQQEQEQHGHGFIGIKFCQEWLVLLGTVMIIFSAISRR